MSPEGAANRLAVKAWTLNTQLEQAQVPQDVRDALLLEIAWEDAYTLLQAQDRMTRFNVQFWTDGQITRKLDDPVPRVTRFPKKGERWTTLYGIDLVWLGK